MRAWPYFVFIVFIACFCRLGAASEPERTTITLERHSAIGVEQTSLQLEGDVVRYISNTNYWQKSKSERFLLGILESKTSPSYAKKIRSLASTDKPWPKAKKNFLLSPHRSRVLLNGEEVPYGGALYESAALLIRKAANAAPGWDWIDAVSVKRDPKTNRLSLEPASKNSALNCEGEIATATCKVENYGLVHR